MKYLLYLTLPFLLLGDTSFITPIEYSSQLYKNPRGIGCDKCHGENGEGKLIANYIHKKQKKSFVGPAINELDFDTFFRALTVTKKGMPRYFLTKKEIQALYLYLHQEDMNKKKNIAKQKKEEKAVAK